MVTVVRVYPRLVMDDDRQAERRGVTNDGSLMMDSAYQPKWKSFGVKVISHVSASMHHIN